ncbi:MAG: D-alanyl-D-alanine carboxypeptidase [Lentisphaerae bacterium]|nr:D-alanyl-D-alanine carboxypeptidase [Lentisphaerota bacterium]
MRERIIALVVCSVIFVTVLIIGIVTAMRSTSRPAVPNVDQPEKTQHTQITSSDLNVPEEAPPVVKKLRFKRNNTPVFYPAFDQSNLHNLPKNLAQYQFKAGILVDLTNRKILWEKQSRRPVPIASLTKLMTIYTAFEELERKEEIDLQTKVTVSTESTQVAEVTAKLKPGSKIKLHELFLGAMLKSANDAAYLIAEYFGNGDHQKFINLMNQKASEIGMTSSSFLNANGLPIYSQNNQPPRMNLASCYDMAKLIERLYNYPMILRYTSCRSTKVSFGELRNGNRLLGAVKGMEGLKTGYTNAAGHCLAFSCVRNKRRLVGVVTGFSKRQNCFDFTSKLLSWGFQQQ